MGAGDEPETAGSGTPTSSNKWVAIGLGVVVVVGIITALALTLGGDDDPAPAPLPSSERGMMNFNRIANFPVCLQFDANCNFENETAAEIIAASSDGNTLVYTDGPLGLLGFIDITDAENPKALGTIEVGGEPTSTAVVGSHAIVCVNTSPNFTHPSGIFHVVDVATQEVHRTGDLGGQPDSVAISPDGKYAVIVIENERDEDFNDGLIPQLPAGFLQVMDISSENVDEWTLTVINLTGLDGALYPSDPEPEYVDINVDNIAAVTLQENNAIVLIDLASGEIVKSFSAGSVDLEGVDLTTDSVVDQSESEEGRLREPDAITWIGAEYLAIANEGDLDGGTRTFSILDTDGNVVYDSGSELEDWTVRLGHFPEGRAEKKGNEPETIRYSEFGDDKILFVVSERSNLIFVYDVADVTKPVFRQVLASGGVGPEGLISIPSRNLMLVANEVDARADVMRAAVSIFEYQEATAFYPTIWSAEDEETGKFIPFGALSGLTSTGTTLFAVEDSAGKSSRMFVIDTGMTPPTVTGAVRIVDSNDVLFEVLSGFPNNETTTMLNEDKTVNLDLEGIDLVNREDPTQGFWLISEGAGTVNDPEHPLESPNLLIRVSEEGVIVDAVTLPDSLNAIQVRNGFEGVAADGENILVTFQREWGDETTVRLGIYNTETMAWKFMMYTLDAPESQNGGWVGLSDAESLGEGVFLVIERDNQGGLDAAIKKIYMIDLGDYSAEEGTVIEKKLFRDLLPDLKMYSGPVYEKIESLTVDGNGDVWIVNDNDGVDDNSGEQILVNLGPVN